jgi:hypothetical protein
MEPRHKEAINGNIVQLSRSTKNLKELLRCMEAAEIINLYEIALINKAKSNGEKCYKFYHMLLRKDASTFKTLVKALYKTGNENLARFLWNDCHDPSEIEFGDEEVRAGRNDDDSSTSRSNIENAAIGFVRPRPRPQTWSTILISSIVLFATAAIPISIAGYMLKIWVDKISTATTGNK